MPDARMDAALDFISGKSAVLLHAEWMHIFLELLAVEMLCSSPSVKDQIAHEMLAVIRGEPL